MDDSFPYDHLCTMSHKEMPWYADWVKFKVCGVMSICYLINNERDSFLMRNIMCGKSLYSTNYMEMEYIKGVFLKMRFLVPSTTTMPQLMVDMLDLTRL